MKRLLPIAIVLACLTNCCWALGTRRAFPNLSFTSPVDFQYDPQYHRIYVVEQAGRIRVFENNENVTQSTLFFDISGRVTSGGERGLLGLAFHPDFATNHFFYVHYTFLAGGNQLKSRISRFTSSSDGLTGNPSSEMILLELNQPYHNHNGGQVSFGPDGYLYIALGDGGSGGDPENSGQDRTSLLGKILRISVIPSGGLNYSIPVDNPYASHAQYRKEIWTWGLRNPWRFSFDSVTNWLWIGDVGQGQWEEVDVIRPSDAKGLNMGWRIMEGSHCFNPSSNCDPTGKVMPVFEYPHSGSETAGKSVTGGFVYRGRTFSNLVGKYICADYEVQKLYLVTFDSADPFDNSVEVIEIPNRISSFGVDADQEVYFLSYTDGAIFQVTGDVDIDTNPSASALPDPSTTPDTVSPSSIVAVSPLLLLITIVFMML